MNRKQKRDQYKAARGNPDALWCDKCGHKTFHRVYRIPGDEDHYDIYCGVCFELKTRLRLTKDDYNSHDNLLHGSRLNDKQKAVVERKVGKIIGQSV